MDASCISWYCGIVLNGFSDISRILFKYATYYLKFISKYRTFMKLLISEILAMLFHLLIKCRKVSRFNQYFHLLSRRRFSLIPGIAFSTIEWQYLFNEKKNQKETYFENHIRHRSNIFHFDRFSFIHIFFNNGFIAERICISFPDACFNFFIYLFL